MDSQNPFSNPEIESGYQRYLTKNPGATREEFLEKRQEIISSPSFKGASFKRVVQTLEGIMIPMNRLSFDEAASLNAESRRIAT